MPLVFRDYCAHLLIPLNDCRVKTWYSPWKCQDLRHGYEKCQYDECVIATGLLRWLRPLAAGAIAAPLPL